VRWQHLLLLYQPQGLQGPWNTMQWQPSLLWRLRGRMRPLPPCGGLVSLLRLFLRPS
jgi:hypothetical protein